MRNTRTKLTMRSAKSNTPAPFWILHPHRLLSSNPMSIFFFKLLDSYDKKSLEFLHNIYERMTKLLRIVLFYEIINDQKEECDRDACIKRQLCVQW